MAWTTPKTDFANGDVLNATQMNNIGGNLQYLYDNDATLLSTTTLSSTSATISGISGAYRHLRLIVRDFTSNSATSNLALQLNGVTTATYEMAGLDTASAWNASAQTSARFTNAGIGFYWGAGTDSLAQIVIPDYTNTATWKMMICNAVRDSGSSSYRPSSATAFLRGSTSAVTSITVLCAGGGTITGTALLYGFN